MYNMPSDHLEGSSKSVTLNWETHKYVEISLTSIASRSIKNTKERLERWLWVRVLAALAEDLSLILSTFILSVWEVFRDKPL